jgi:two-component system KDP operon response regulator KdpE
MRCVRWRGSAIILAASELGVAIASASEANGLTSTMAGDEYDALHRIRTEGPELFLVDLEASGATEALRAIADESLVVTVLALTPADDAGATLRALADGAHSCAPRSCGATELHARIEALLRRPPRSRAASARFIHVGDIRIDPAARSVSRAGDPLALAPSRFDVLLTLARERGGVVTHARLIDACRWGRVRRPGLRGIIADLRRLTGLCIRAVPRVGYVLPAISRD